MFKLNLQLFGEGTGTGAGAGAAAPGGEGTQAVTQPATGQSRNSLSDVKYGIQEETQGEADTSKGVQTPPVETIDRKAAFEQLIKGDYKDEYNARVQEAINKRFKANDAAAERQKSLAPILEILGNKYGIDASDIDKMDLNALSKAIMDDDSYYEQEAVEKGITVEALKNIKRMEAENKQMKEAMAQRQKQDQTRRAYEELLKQSDEVMKVYPTYNLATEMANPDFARLVANGVNAKTAYEVVHKDEIQPAMAQYIANQTAQKIANDIQAGQRRPAENGANSQSSSVVKTDVTKLTKEDRAEIARRVARGETIRF